MHLLPNLGLWRRQSGFKSEKKARRQDKDHTAVPEHFKSRGGSGTITLKMMAEALD